MPLDPNIALQVGQPVQPLDPMKAYGQVLTLKNLIDQQQMNGLQAEALRAKMGRDAEDQQFDTALKRTKVLQGAAAGLSALPPERRALAWPQVRSVLAHSGINDMPEQYPGDDIVDAYAALGADPNKLMEVARTTAQQKAFAEAQAAARNKIMGGGQPAPQSAPGAGVQPGDVVAPTEVVSGRRSFSMDPAYHTTLADLVNQDPRLSGTKFGDDALNMGLKIEKDTRDAEGSGLHFVTGQDGKTYTFKNGRLIDTPVSTGRDPNAPFWTGDNGEPVPNTVAQNFQRTKAREGATSINVQNNPIPLGKPAEGKVDEGLLDTSATLMRLSGIRKQYKPEWSEFSTQAGMKLNQLGERYLGVKVAPATQEKFRQYTQWRQKAKNNINLTIQSLTGAAMSDTESKRIMATLPSDDDSATEFQAKLDGAEEQAKMALARFTYIKRNRGMSIADVPLESMPDVMRARDREIEGDVSRRYPNMSAAERNDLIKRQLAQEFGLIGK